MKWWFRIGFGLCLLSAFAPGAFAQYPQWLDVEPPGEPFHVSMPNQPRLEAENVGAVSGNRYLALTGFARYTIWSLKNSNYSADRQKDTDAYLDATAELVWEGLLKSEREKVDEKDRRFSRMTYERELPHTPLPGREYNLTIGTVTGTAQFFVAGEQIFVMLVLGKPGEDWPRERFFASFKTSLTAPATAAQPQFGAGTGPAPVDETDPNRIFSGKEVTSKARVTEKPEPTYTESARKFGVQGTVVMRCVFSKNGEVTNIHVISKLPHGMTQSAVAAARKIQFTPATKDGQPVSMWMELQYNFNLY